MKTLILPNWLRLTTVLILILAAFTPASIARADGAWQNVGAPGFSAGLAYYTSLAVDNGIPYVAYADFANGHKATVMKYDGTAWVAVGAPGFSAGGADYTSLTVDNGTPYVAYMDSANGHKATVMKYDGTAGPASSASTLPKRATVSRSFPGPQTWRKSQTPCPSLGL